MKYILPAILAVVAIALGVVLYNTNQTDTAQHNADAASLTDFSNKLTSAQALIATHEATITTFSNQLNDSWASSLVLSNQLADAQSTSTLEAQKIASLNQQVASDAADNQSLNQQIAGLNKKVTSLDGKIAATEASLAQTNSALAQMGKDYVLLENRLRVDIGERTVAERKFNNPAELQAQLAKLKNNPGQVITADKILAGLNIEVRSNGTYHVITPE